MSDSARQAEEHHAEVIRDQQARRVETLEEALAAALGYIWSPPEPAVQADYQKLTQDRNRCFAALEDS